MLIIQDNSCWHSSVPTAAINKKANVLSTPHHNSNLNNFMVNRYSFNRYSFAGKLSTIDILEDRNLSQQYFKNNLKNQKPLFGTINNASLLFTNERIANNFAIFMKSHSDEKIKQAENSEIKLTEKQLNVYKELYTFFDEYLKDVDKNKNIRISFKQVPQIPQTPIDKYDEVEARKLVVGHALACAASAGAIGKASITGLDAWIQRGIQLRMFGILADIFDVPYSAALIYAGTEYASKANLGMDASMYINSLIGIVTDLGSGFSLTPVTEATTRMGNATISYFLTRRMGLGFINQVKAHKMNIKGQLTRSGQYAIRKEIFNGFNYDHDFSALESPENISDAIDNIPDEIKSLYGEIFSEVMNYSTRRAPFIFLTNFLPPLMSILKDNPNSQKFKAIAQESLKNTIITGLVYEACDTASDAIIIHEAKHNFDIINKKLYEDPEIYQQFTKVLDDVSNKLKLDKMEDIESLEFINQFKNKSFVFELANCIEPDIKQLARKINEKSKNDLKLEQNNLNSTLKNSQNIKDQYNKDEKKQERVQLNKILKATIPNKKNIKNGVTVHGFDRVAGYTDEIMRLNSHFGILAQDEQTIPEEFPNVILLYGPRGIGKTNLVTAARENYACAGVKKTLIGNKRKCLETIKRYAQMHKERYEKDPTIGQMIFQLDECTSFINMPKSDEEKKILEEFNDFIKNCASKYHMTIFMTTNHPQQIYPDIIKNPAISLKMPVNVANKNEIIEILKLYTNENCKDNIDYKYIAEKILEKAKNNNAAFSNTQIMNIALCKSNNIKNQVAMVSQEDMLNELSLQKPEISNEELIEFQQNKEYVENLK